MLNNLCKLKIAKITFHLFRYSYSSMKRRYIESGVLELTSFYQRTLSKRNIIMVFLLYMYLSHVYFFLIDKT